MSLWSSAAPQTGPFPETALLCPANKTVLSPPADAQRAHPHLTGFYCTLERDRMGETLINICSLEIITFPCDVAVYGIIIQRRGAAAALPESALVF